MIFCRAKVTDIDQILSLHKTYHVDTISERDRADGFVTTPFTEELLRELIQEEQGAFVAKEGNRIAGYAMSASWDYWVKWPLFQLMAEGLDDLDSFGQTLNRENSYQYGPVCLDKKYRGSGVFEDLFYFTLEEMASRYKFLVTFINRANHRSMAAHTRRLGLPVVKEFEYGGQHYAEIVCPTTILPYGIR